MSFLFLRADSFYFHLLGGPKLKEIRLVKNSVVSNNDTGQRQDLRIYRKTAKFKKDLKTLITIGKYHKN